MTYPNGPSGPPDMPSSAISGAQPMGVEESNKISTGNTTANSHGLLISSQLLRVHLSHVDGDRIGDAPTAPDIVAATSHTQREAQVRDKSHDGLDLRNCLGPAYHQGLGRDLQVVDLPERIISRGSAAVDLQVWNLGSQGLDGTIASWLCIFGGIKRGIFVTKLALGSERSHGLKIMNQDAVARVLLIKHCWYHHTVSESRILQSPIST